MIREILDAHRAGDDHTIEAWSARLGQNQRKNVQRLLSLGQEVTEALYALTPFVGLWEAFEIGRIPALQKLHCPQVRPSSIITRAIMAVLTSSDRNWRAA